jgi:hypothetical protein
LIMMAIASYERTRVVEAKLVQKRTFLHLEPQEDSLDECCSSQCVRKPLKRTMSDTFVDYSFEQESDAISTTLDSPRSMVSEDFFSGSTHEEFSCSSQASDTEESVSDEHLSASATSSHSGFSPNTQNGAQVLSQQGQICFCYVAMAAPQDSTPAPTFMPASHVVSEALKYKAQAAELHAEAARLKAEAFQCEALAHASTPAMPPGQFCAMLSQGSSPALPPGQFCMPRQSSHVGASRTGQQELTTLMLRNIPNDYTREMLLALLDSEGFATKYDFVYLPMDFNRKASLGYAFVNFVSQADAELAKSVLDGFTAWKVQSPKTCKACWVESHQGLEAHIERYRSSPVMHHTVPEEFKPIVFRNGVRVPFPAPTKRVRKPRADHNGDVA